MLLIARPSWSVKHTTCSIPNSHQSNPVTFMTYASISKNIFQETCLKALLHGTGFLWPPYRPQCPITMYTGILKLLENPNTPTELNAATLNSVITEHSAQEKPSDILKTLSMLQKNSLGYNCFWVGRGLEGFFFFSIQPLPILFNAFSSLRLLQLWISVSQNWLEVLWEILFLLWKLQALQRTIS